MSMMMEVVVNCQRHAIPWPNAIVAIVLFALVIVMFLAFIWITSRCVL